MTSSSTMEQPDASVNQSLLPDEYLPMLDELNRIVIASGAPLEGNLYYYHHEPAPNRDNISPYFLNKRSNFAAASKAGTTMLEIGLNAGHSALLALANGVEYHGVDICMHPYTLPAAAFLKETFGDRFHFYEGDSRKVLPSMPIGYPYLRFDVISIDGHHDVSFCATDTANAIPLSLKNAWIIIDDTDLEAIDLFYREQLQKGALIEGRPEGWVDNIHHAIARIP